jgi:hypothetical protein
MNKISGTLAPESARTASAVEYQALALHANRRDERSNALDNRERTEKLWQKRKHSS